MADRTPSQQTKTGLPGSGRKKARSRPADGSYFLNECASYLNRVSRIFLLQGVSLPPDSPPLYQYTNINSLDNSKYLPCQAINSRRFYKAWNRHSLGEFQDKQEQRLPIRSLPLVFDSFGRFYPEWFLAANFARIVALNMPSSCKDISMLTSVLFHYLLHSDSNSPPMLKVQNRSCPSAMPPRIRLRYD
jgi:hypothetical protein